MNGENGESINVGHRTQPSIGGRCRNWGQCFMSYADAGDLVEAFNVRMKLLEGENQK